MREHVIKKQRNIKRSQRRESKISESSRERDRLTVSESLRSSRKGRRTDALALRAEERRDKLRKAVGRSKYSVIHRYLNGETRLEKIQSLLTEYIG